MKKKNLIFSIFFLSSLMTYWDPNLAHALPCEFTPQGGTKITKDLSSEQSCLAEMTTAASTAKQGGVYLFGTQQSYIHKIQCLIENKEVTGFTTQYLLAATSIPQTTLNDCFVKAKEAMKADTSYTNGSSAVVTFTKDISNKTAQGQNIQIHTLYKAIATIKATINASDSSTSYVENNLAQLKESFFTDAGSKNYYSAIIAKAGKIDTEWASGAKKCVYADGSPVGPGLAFDIPGCKWQARKAAKTGKVIFNLNETLYVGQPECKIAGTALSTPDYAPTFYLTTGDNISVLRTQCLDAAKKKIISDSSYGNGTTIQVSFPKQFGTEGPDGDSGETYYKLIAKVKQYNNASETSEAFVLSQNEFRDLSNVLTTKFNSYFSASVQKEGLIQTEWSKGATKEYCYIMGPQPTTRLWWQATTGNDVKDETACKIACDTYIKANLGKFFQLDPTQFKKCGDAHLVYNCRYYKDTSSGSTRSSINTTTPLVVANPCFKWDPGTASTPTTEAPTGVTPVSTP